MIPEILFSSGLFHLSFGVCVGMASTKVCAQDFSHRLLWATNGCWESNHSPLEEQPKLLNSAISPHWCKVFCKLSAIIKDSYLTYLLPGALGQNNGNIQECFEGIVLEDKGKSWFYLLDYELFQLLWPWAPTMHTVDLIVRCTMG